MATRPNSLGHQAYWITIIYTNLAFVPIAFFSLFLFILPQNKIFDFYFTPCYLRVPVSFPFCLQDAAEPCGPPHPQPSHYPLKRSTMALQACLSPGRHPSSSEPLTQPCNTFISSALSQWPHGRFYGR